MEGLSQYLQVEHIRYCKNPFTSYFDPSYSDVHAGTTRTSRNTTTSMNFSPSREAEDLGTAPFFQRRDRWNEPSNSKRGVSGPRVRSPLHRIWFIFMR